MDYDWLQRRIFTPARIGWSFGYEPIGAGRRATRQARGIGTYALTGAIGAAAVEPLRR
jgi:hypothetical protein